MNKEDKYSNRMSLPKDGMTLAKNENILLRGLYVPRIQEAGIYFILVEENEEVNIYKLCWRSYDFDESELRRFIVRSRV